MTKLLVPTSIVLASAVAGVTTAVLQHPQEEVSVPAPVVLPLVGSLHSLATAPDDALLSLLKKHANGRAPDDAYARETLVARLVTIDPPGAVKLSRSRSEFVNRVLAEFGVSDNAGEPFDIGNRVVREKRIDPVDAVAILKLLSDSDTAGARRAMENALPSAASDALTREIGETLKSDPEKAVADAIAQFSASQLEPKLRHLFQMWAETDPAAAWAAIESTPLRVDRGRLQYEVVRKWFEHDPHGAATALTSGATPLENNAIAPLVEGLFKISPETAQTWAKQSTGLPYEKEIFDKIAEEFGKSSPADALAAVRAGFHLNAPQPDRTLERFAGNFGSAHPEDAIRWAGGYQGANRTEILAKIADSTANEHPEETFDLLEGASIPPENLGDLAGEARQLALHDLPRYLALFAQADEKTAMRVIGDAAKELASNDRPEEAAALFEQVGFENDTLEDSVQRTVTEWTENDVAGSSQWVSSLPPGVARNNATINLVDQWVHHDRAAAMSYAWSLPPGSAEREHAAYALAQRLTASEPEAALQWAAELAGNEKLQNKFLSSGELTSLIYHAPDQLQQIFPDNEKLKERIGSDQAWRSYLRSYTP